MGQADAKLDIESTPAQVVLGQAATFTATVTDPTLIGQVATGTVSFSEGTVQLGTGVLDTSGHATLTTSTLALGMHTITASYAGDGTFGAASNFTTEEVDPSGSVSGRAWADANGNGIDDPLELGLANVAVTLNDPNGNSIYTLTDASGNYAFTGLVPGTYTVSTSAPGMALEGYYQDDGTPIPTASVTLTPAQPIADIDAAFMAHTGAGTTTSLTASTLTSTVGQAVTFTASVSPTSGMGFPGGVVQFYDGNTLLSSVMLSAG